MIGVDTNVLLRLVVNDDPAQNDLVKAFFAKRSVDDPAYVGLVVIAEFTWLLGRHYGYSKTQIADVLIGLLDSVDLVIERPELVQEAALLSREPRIDFADVLIARLGQERQCTTTVTFDRNAAKRIAGMDLLA